MTTAIATAFAAEEMAGKSVEPREIVLARMQVELDLIDDNPFQPRLSYDEQGIRELALNIARVGLLSIPRARPAASRFQAALGHRRIRAVRLLWQWAREILAGQEGSPKGLIDADDRAVLAWHSRQLGGPREWMYLDVGEMTDEEMAVVALSENEQRKDLTDLERVRAYRKAIDGTELSISGLAGRVGVNRSTMSNYLRLLHLPDFILEHVESGDLT